MQATNAVKSNNLVLLFKFYNWKYSPEVLKAAIELMESSDNIQGELLYKTQVVNLTTKTTFEGFKAYMPSFLGNMIVDSYGNTMLTKFGRWYNGALNIKNISFEHDLYSHLFRNYGDSDVANNSLLLLCRPAVINELKRIYYTVAAKCYNVYAFHSLEQMIYVIDAYKLLKLDKTIGVNGTLLEEDDEPKEESISLASNLSSKVEVYYSENPPIMPLAGFLDGSETDSGGIGNGNHTNPDQFQQNTDNEGGGGGGGGGTGTGTGTGSGTTSEPSDTPTFKPGGSTLPGSGIDTDLDKTLQGLKSTGDKPLLAFYVPYTLNDKKYEELNGMTIGEYFKQNIEAYHYVSDISTDMRFLEEILKNRSTLEEILLELLPEEEDE